MKCIFCGKEFEVIKIQGGSNRKICYECMPSGLSKKERTALKQKIISNIVNNLKIKQGCSKCGYNKCAKALEWHHLDKTTKENDLSEFIRNGDISGFLKYLEEIKKCVLLCSNCHREEHDKHKSEGVV